MLSQSFINRAFYIVRLSCEHCSGTGQVEHPLIEAYRKSGFNSWYDFFSASGMSITYLPTKEKMNCPSCNGLGYEERELTLSSLVDHCFISDETLERQIRQVIYKVREESLSLDDILGPVSDELENKIRQVIREIERENQTLSNVFGPDPDELENKIRQVVRNVLGKHTITSEQGLRDLADFLDPEE